MRLDEYVRSCCVCSLPNPPPADERGSVLVRPKHSWLRLPGVKKRFPYADEFLRQAVLLSVKKPRQQRLFFAPVGRKKRVGPALEQGGARLLLALKMPAQERLSRSGGALTPTQTRHPANGLKCLFLHPPLISCKNRLPRRGTEGAK